MIDIEKAFDTISWNFIEKLLNLYEFQAPLHSPNHLLPKECQIHTHLKWKKKKTSSFLPSRGIRQGYPISPYIFILTIEYLSKLIQDKIMEKNMDPL